MQGLKQCWCRVEIFLFPAQLSVVTPEKYHLKPYGLLKCYLPPSSALEGQLHAAGEKSITIELLWERAKRH